MPVGNKFDLEVSCDINIWWHAASDTAFCLYPMGKKIYHAFCWHTMMALDRWEAGYTFCTWQPSTKDEYESKSYLFKLINIWNVLLPLFCSSEHVVTLWIWYFPKGNVNECNRFPILVLSSLGSMKQRYIQILLENM